MNQNSRQTTKYHKKTRIKDMNRIAKEEIF